MIIAITFFADNSDYLNIKSVSEDERLMEYWRCMVVSAVAARLQAIPGDRVIIFTNSKPPAKMSSILDRHGVELIEIPFTFAPPLGFWQAWGGAFYLFDAIKWFAETPSEHDEILLIDPDCLATAPLAQVQEEIKRAGAVFYDLRFPREANGNGLSRIDMSDIARSIWGDNHQRTVRWLGGEFIGITKGTAQTLSSAILSAWTRNLSLHREGKAKFNTEEQLLSAVVDRHNISFSDAGDYFVKRFWTASVFRNYSPKDVGAVAWHLPSEKHRGFQRLFSMLQETGELPVDILLRNNKRLLSYIMHLRGDYARSAAFSFRRFLGNLGDLIRKRTETFSAGA